MAATPKKPNAGKKPNANTNPYAGMTVISNSPIPRNTGPGLASKPVPGALVNRWDMTVIGVRPSNLTGKSGALGGQHAGGHSDIGERISGGTSTGASSSGIKIK